MNKKISKFLEIMCSIVFSISTVFLSCQLIVHEYEIDIVVLTVIVSLICSLYFFRKTFKEILICIKENKIINIIFIGLAIIVWLKLYLIKGVSSYETNQNYIINIFRLRFFLISLFSIMYLSIFLGNRITKYILEFYTSLDEWDKKVYVISSFILFVIIIIAYNFSSNWYLQYDKVYSLDSGWCFSNILPDPNYYDVRHPILSVFTFPVFAIIDTLIKILIPGNLCTTVEAVIFQYINIQLLIVTGIQIKKIINNKMFFIIYMVSFSTILYSIFFEKYVFCVFLLVLYVLSLCNRKDDKSFISLILAFGVMPTSCFMGIMELINNNKLKQKIIRIMQIGLVTFLIFTCFGRGHMLKYGLYEVIYMKSSFSNQTFSIIEKIISTTKMIQSVFIALPSEIVNDIYLWDSLGNRISIVAFAIIAIIIIGIIKNRNEIFVKISTIWSMFAFVLFVILNWSVHESPLFNIYFSWSLIPLFVMGLDFVIEKFKLNRKYVYGTIILLMFIVNISTMISIQNYLFTL